MSAVIAKFLADDDPRFEWLKPAVREHGFLPLYLGWTAVLGVRPDGSFVRWEHEYDHPSVRPLVSGFWRRAAICEGARKYPELRALLPARPADAQTCAMCGGSGESQPDENATCACGGCGWIVPGESAGDLVV